VFAPNFVAIAQETFEKQNKVLVLCQRTDTDVDGNEIGLAPWFYQGSCIGLPRDWLYEVGGFDEFFTRWGDVDLDISGRAGCAGFTSIWITERTKITHQWHQLQTRETVEANSAHRLAMEGVIVRNDRNWGKI
jgi:GT2 family glycosyltransferase